MAYLTAPKPRYITSFDLLTNVMGYSPFGALAVLALYPRVRGVPAVLAALAAGTALSAVMEGLQTGCRRASRPISTSPPMRWARCWARR